MPGGQSLREGFGLGEWWVDPARNLLSRDGSEVHLRPKVMDLLVVLASQPGTVLSAEALQMAVWGRRYLARSALAGAICELREALGDDSQQPRFIQTVAKRGYCLSEPVRTGRTSEVTSAQEVSSPAPRRRLRWLAVAGSAAALLAVVAGVTLSSRQRTGREALDALERGRRYLREVESPDAVLLGLKSLERAVQLDPASVAGHVELAHAHALAHHLGFDRSPEREAQARMALERARSLAPRDVEVAWGDAFMLYVFEHDYPSAFAKLGEVEQQRPANAYDLRFEGVILRRMGRPADALDRFRRAFALEPSSWRLAYEVAMGESTLGQYALADRDFARSIELAPDQVSAYWGRARNALLWKGSVAEARAILAAMPQLERAEVAAGWLVVDLCARDFDAAIARLGRISDVGLDGQAGIAVRSLLVAETLRLKGDGAGARQAYEAAKAQIEARLAATPDDWRVHSALGLALGGLGRREEALAEARRGVELCPPSKDAIIAPFALVDLAEVQVMTGDLDGAVASLARLLAQPANPDATPVLDLEPWWEPLRGHPGFEVLLARQRAGRSG